MWNVSRSHPGFGARDGEGLGPGCKLPEAPPPQKIPQLHAVNQGWGSRLRRSLILCEGLDQDYGPLPIKLLPGRLGTKQAHDVHVEELRV